MASDWVEVGPAEILEAEDVMRFDHDGRTFAIYRTEGGELYASDGLCTHEHVHLADGFVIGDVIECPRHQGRFHIPSGRAKGAPACIDLRTYRVRVEGGSIFIELGR